MIYPYNQYNYQPVQAPMQAPMQNAINWVSGENGAKAWMLGRGETALLMDSESQVFYIKSTDASGMPQPLRVFNYTERPTNGLAGPQSAFSNAGDKTITREEFDDLRAKYEELARRIPKGKKTEVIDE